jgi:hypothetical protein
VASYGGQEGTRKLAGADSSNSLERESKQAVLAVNPPKGVQRRSRIYVDAPLLQMLFRDGKGRRPSPWVEVACIPVAISQIHRPYSIKCPTWERALLGTPGLLVSSWPILATVVLGAAVATQMPGQPERSFKSKLSRRHGCPSAPPTTRSMGSRLRLRLAQRLPNA